MLRNISRLENLMLYRTEFNDAEEHLLISTYALQKYQK